MTRCNSNGQNSRTHSSRSSRGLRSFGVRLTDGSAMKKSASMGNLSRYSAAAADSSVEFYSDGSDNECDSRRCLRARRKEIIPWTKGEHRNFLLGLKKLGRDDWQGISKVYVPSRTPSQVASHAKRHFFRQSIAYRRKKQPNMVAKSSIKKVWPPCACSDNENLVFSSTKAMPLDASMNSLSLSLGVRLKSRDAYSLKNDGLRIPHQPIISPTPIFPEDQLVEEIEQMSRLNLGET